MQARELGLGLVGALAHGLQFLAGVLFSSAMVRVALTTLSTGAISLQRLGLFDLARVFFQFALKVPVDLAISDRRSIKAASIWRISLCACSVRSLASFCLKMTSFSRRSTSSRRRRVSGGGVARPSGPPSGPEPFVLQC